MDILVIIGIIIVGGGLYFLITNLPKKPKKKKTKETSSDSNTNIEEGDEEEEEEEEDENLAEGVVNTGKLTQVAEKYWILNPKSPFPLTVFPIDSEQAHELKSILELRYNTTTTETIRKLLPFIKEHDIRCKEIDEYIKVFRPIFLAKVKEINTTSVSWEGATPGPALKELAEFTELAVSSLELQLFCDLNILFRGHPKSKKTKDELIKKFGADIMKIYASMRKGINTIPYKPETRKSLQRLEKLKLLAYGADINPKLLLKTFSLAKMKQLVGDLSYPNFENKEEAFNAISKLPDLTNRLQTIVNFKTIYQKLPIPSDHDKFKITEGQKEHYLKEFATLLSNTYYRGGISIAEQKEFQDKSYSFVKGWEISTKNDACIFCKKQSEKSYDKEDYPLTPIHLGCRCTVMTA